MITLDTTSMARWSGSFEKVDLKGIDEVASLTKAWLQAVDMKTRKVKVTLSHGISIEGDLAQDLEKADVKTL